VERNRPATFERPLWSLIGDFHMYGLMWAGRMDAEVARLAGDGA
ncbi:MAG: Mpo1-like protein, partial [Alphaproteobacteria bacterium]